MNKRTFSNLMSIEKKALERNAANYRELLASDEDLTPSKRGRTFIGENATHTSATFGLIINPQRTERLVDKDQSNDNAEIISLLKAILDQQNNIAAVITNLDNRVSNLETYLDDLVTSSKEKIINKSEVMAQSKVMCECKVLIKNVHRSIIRMTGEDDDAYQTDIATTLPLNTIDAAEEVEGKLSNKEYLNSMKLHLLGLKSSSGDIGKMMRRIYTDDLLWDYNWAGKAGKLALAQYSLVTDILYGISNFKDRKSYETEMKACILRSHNRMKQKRRSIRSFNICEEILDASPN